MKTVLRLLTGSFLLLAACSHGPTSADSTEANPHAVTAMDRRHPAGAQRLAVLPDQAKWQSLYDFVDNLDLTDPSIEIKSHEGNGTSVYAVISVNGKVWGAVIPENASASVTGETMGFTLSRALGFSDITQAGVYHFLSGKNLEAFMKIVPRTPYPASRQNKEYNRKMILSRYAKQPQGMDAVVKRWDAKPKDFEQIDGPNRMISPTFTMTGSSSPLASLIKCDGPVPSKEKTVTINGGTNTEFEAAREVSNILLLDALEGQWDRFSGGNFQTVTKEGHTMFVAIDNGGTWGGTKKGDLSPTQRNLSMVTRFDRYAAEQILAMNELVQNGKPFMNLHNQAELMSALDISQSPKIFAKFADNLRATAAHIRAHQNCYF